MILAQDGGGGPSFPPWVFFAVIIVIIYMLMIRPQRKKDQQRRRMLESLKKGSRVVTIGGVLGTIISIKEKEVVVRIDEETGTRVKMLRSAINRIVEDNEQDAKDKGPELK